MVARRKSWVILIYTQASKIKQNKNLEKNKYNYINVAFIPSFNS